jgi:hypothetical protein
MTPMLGPVVTGSVVTAGAQATFESFLGFAAPEPDDDSDLLELLDEPFDDDLSDPDFESDSALVPDSDLELSEVSPDLPFEPPLTEPARLSVR